MSESQFSPEDRARFDREIARRQDLVRKIKARLDCDFWQVDGEALNRLYILVLSLDLERITQSLEAYGQRAAPPPAQAPPASSVEEVQ